MNNPQSIIVYRNPLEAAIWEGTYSETLFPIMVALFAGFLVFVIVHGLFDRYLAVRIRKMRYQTTAPSFWSKMTRTFYNNVTPITTIVSVSVALAIFWKMH